MKILKLAIIALILNSCENKIVTDMYVCKETYKHYNTNPFINEYYIGCLIDSQNGYYKMRVQRFENGEGSIPFEQYLTEFDFKNGFWIKDTIH